MNSKPDPCMSTRMLPSANISMAVRTIRLGELVKSGLTHPRSTEASQNDRNTSIEIVPSRVCSCRAQNVLGGPASSSSGGRAGAVSGAGPGLPDTGCARSSARDRMRLVIDAPFSCHRQHAGLVRFLLDQPPDALLAFQERRLQLDRQRTLQLQLDRDDVLDAGGPRGGTAPPVGQ